MDAAEMLLIEWLEQKLATTTSSSSFSSSSSPSSSESMVNEGTSTSGSKTSLDELLRVEMDDSLASEQLLVKSIKSFLAQIKTSKTDLAKLSNAKEKARLESIIDFSCLASSWPSLDVWADVLRLYAQRHAWDVCVLLMHISEAQIHDDKEEMMPIYEQTVRVLCDCDQFDLALKVVQRVRQRGLKPGPVILTHLLKSRQITRQALDGRVADYIFSAICSLSAEAGECEGGEMNKQQHRAKEAARGLCSARGSVLTRGGAASEAEHLMRLLASNGEKRLIRPAVIATIIQAHALSGQWKKAEALFWDLQRADMSGKEDGQLTEGTPFADVIVERNSSDFPIALSASYHHITGAMRNDQQIKHIARFAAQVAIANGKDVGMVPTL